MPGAYNPQAASAAAAEGSRIIRVLGVLALVVARGGAGVTAEQRPQPAGQRPAPAAPAARRAVEADENPIAPPKEFQDLMKSNAAINPDGNGGTLNQNLAEGA